MRQSGQTCIIYVLVAWYFFGNPLWGTASEGCRSAGPRRPARGQGGPGRAEGGSPQGLRKVGAMGPHIGRNFESCFL